MTASAPSPLKKRGWPVRTNATSAPEDVGEACAGLGRLRSGQGVGHHLRQAASAHAHRLDMPADFAPAFLRRQVEDGPLRVEAGGAERREQVCHATGGEQGSTPEHGTPSRKASCSDRRCGIPDAYEQEALGRAPAAFERPRQFAGELFDSVASQLASLRPWPSGPQRLRLLADGSEASSSRSRRPSSLSVRSFRRT